MIEAYPLCWPPDYPRSSKQRKSQFKTTLGKARDYVKDEIRRLEATQPIISTNVPLKNDGDLRADWTRYRIDDTGVAVYFIRDKQPVCLCCDTYTTIAENLHAVGRTIEALRQINRDGVSDFLNRSFRGFKALPENTLSEDVIWKTLGLEGRPESITFLDSAYKAIARKVHPDLGGTADEFIKVKQAYEQAKKLFT